MSKVLYLSHGGGPLPLLQPESHANMIKYYEDFGKNYKPDAIIVFSAHMERDVFTIIGNHPKELLYDYYGFPKESYDLEYNPPIDNVLTNNIAKLLKGNNIKSIVQTEKFDHGVYIPLMIMYPSQDIPVIQISLKKGLNEKDHIDLGIALSSLQEKNILFIGSGSSFHNLRSILDQTGNDKNNMFHDGLVDVLTKDVNEHTRQELLIDWKSIPHATFSHPRSEHLIPLLICYGIKRTKAIISFDDTIMNKRNICALWN